MKKSVMLLFGLLILLSVCTSALGEVSAPTVTYDGNEVYKVKTVYDYDISEGSLLIKWDKEADAAKYKYRVIGMQSEPQFTSDESASGTVLLDEEITSNTTTSRKFTIKTSVLEDYAYFKIAIAAYDSSETSYWTTFGIRITDLKGTAGIPVFDDYKSGEVYDLDISKLSSLRIDYFAENADAYYVRAILLDEKPSGDQYQSEHAVGTVYESKSRTYEYVKLQASKMAGAKYMKVAVGAYGTREEYSDAHWAWIGFRLIDNSEKFSVESNSWSADYTGDSTDITVTGDYTYTYPTEDETEKGKKWLTAGKSGSSLTIEARPNYGTSSRSETITITSSDGQSETITVTQGCGYAAPIASIRIGNTSYSSGDTYGPLANDGDDVLYLTVDVKNARRIFVGESIDGLDAVEHTITASDSTTSHACNFTIPKGLAAGTYTFTVYVSNSNVKNDAWSQAIAPITLKVTVVDNSVSTGTDPYPPSGSTLLAVAQSQLGYTGSASSSNTTGANVTSVGDYTKYGEYTGTNGDDWCASFVSWCAKQAGVSGIKKSAGASPGHLCSNAYNKGGVVYFNTLNDTQKANHSYLETYGIKGVRSEVTPSAGDLIFFRWSGTASKYTFSHVGIVSKVEGGNVYYIDGNGDGDIVKERSKSLTSTDIAAYCKVNGVYSTDCAHSSVNWSVIQAATCTATGVEESHCINCGAIIDTRSIAAKGHTAGTWQIITNATATSTGLKRQSCTVCGATVNEEVIPALTSTSTNITFSASGNSVGAPGQDVTVTVNVSNPDNVAIGVLSLDFALPSGVTIRKVELCGIAVNARILAEGNPTIITALNGIQGNGKVLEVVFALDNNIPLPAKVTMTPLIMSLHDEKESSLSSFSAVIQGNSTRIPGDVTGDGNVNFADLLRLAKYLAKWSGIEINASNSDCTGDGSIGFADLLRLAKYLAKWNVTLE